MNIHKHIIILKIRNKKLISKYKKYINKKKEGKINIIVPKIKNAEGKYNIYTDLDYLCEDANMWSNLWMSKYYDVNSIIPVK